MARDATERGWSRDVDTRRNRRPHQRIEYEDGHTVVLTPSWRYACRQCGHEKRFASESPDISDRCPECDELVWFEPLGELSYPGDDDDG